MPNLTNKAPYYKVRRVIRQPDSRRVYGTLPRKHRHSGLGITLVWLNSNMIYQDDRTMWSATCSDASFHRANEIDAEVISDINKVYRVDDYRASVANYDANVLYNIVSRVCHNPRHMLGFTLRLPQTYLMVPIDDLRRIIIRSSNFMGVVLRLSALSATSGTIGVWKGSKDIKIFTHSVGEYVVAEHLLVPFIEHTFLGSPSPIGGFSSACLFKAEPLTPISKLETGELSEISGTPGSYRSL